MYLRSQKFFYFFVLGLTLLSGLAVAEETAVTSYHKLVAADSPAVYWRFNGDLLGQTAAAAGDPLGGILEGNVSQDSAGPCEPEYPAFGKNNAAVGFVGKRGLIRVNDPGEKSVLDFDNGHSITLEAWVKPYALADGQNVYIVGKGRTNNPKFPRENQNYALRLRGMGGTARVSFLFRSRENRAGERNDFHRWTSDVGFVTDDRWHYVAVSYVFGKPTSIRGYIDGRAVSGTWDIGGATAKPPVVDNDELWIGSSLGGSANSTFAGLIDEVAIYRRALDENTIFGRFQTNLPDLRQAELADKDLPDDTVLMEIHEGIPAKDSWDFTRPKPVESYTEPAFAMLRVPHKYSDKGLTLDRTNPFLLRARGKVVVEPDEYEILLRAKSAARLYVDGQLVAQTDFMNRNSSGHEKVPKLAAPQRKGLYPLAPGHQETLASVSLDKGEHVFRLEMIVGGKGLRADLGEACVAISHKGKPFVVISPQKENGFPLNVACWLAFADDAHRRLDALEAEKRMAAQTTELAYWQRRHELAREIVRQASAPKVPTVSSEIQIRNDVDRFVVARLESQKVQPADFVDDYAFIRRVFLDTVGVIPSREEIREFLADENPERRAQLIDRLLDDLRWGDHWVGYWQDVLAENPGILKPKLNNTGPFRFWIYESFRDNKPMDRFVTELIMMEGSKYEGGPAGFAMATQNDVPMAAKAQVIGKAFLGMEMTCARCHDAPYHSYKQSDLMGMAAMLDRKPIKLPPTSSLPAGGRKAAVEVTLKPGDVVQPGWAFGDSVHNRLPTKLMRNPSDLREQFAAIVTSPKNERFAQVIVNRLWQRLMGDGLVESVDDWEGEQASHPELLRYLGRELVLNGYDLKHVARLILNSATYQRKVRSSPEDRDKGGRRLFAAQTRRRMSAEQIVDSLYAAAGKSFNSEQLTFDPEGRRSISTFLNLGAPRRAWQFTSLANERDRPALALPVAQSVIDVLTAYGWRASRPNPVTLRDDTPTMLQPLALANGTAVHRVVGLSEDSEFTRMALKDISVSALVDELFLQLLSRCPTDQQRELFTDLLSDGYVDRVSDRAATPKRLPRRRSAVSWANHLNGEATRIKLELELAARLGDPPTVRLQEEWRKRMEDAVWVLMNSPEFVFIP